MLTTARTIVICLLLSANLCRAENTQEKTTSEWSPITSNLAIRVTSLRNFETDHTWPYDFFVACEIKNTSKKQVSVKQGARIYLVDDSGDEQRCLKYTSGIYLTPTLKPGEITRWWQHGRTKRQGEFRAHVRWDAKPGKKSASVPIAIEASDIPESEIEAYRAKILQSHADQFVEMSPNTTLANAAYTNIVFSGDPIVVNGKLYNAFSFVVPKQQAGLRWSFITPQAGDNNAQWYIIPVEGNMRGFSTFESRILDQDVPEIAEKGDGVLFQWLPGDRLKPDTRYLMWFNCRFREIPSVTLSLNIFPKRQSYQLAFPQMSDAITGLPRDGEYHVGPHAGH